RKRIAVLFPQSSISVELPVCHGFASYFTPVLHSEHHNTTRVHIKIHSNPHKPTGKNTHTHTHKYIYKHSHTTPPPHTHIYIQTDTHTQIMMHNIHQIVK